MIVGHEAGLFMTAEEFARFTIWLRDEHDWTVKGGTKLPDDDDRVLVYEATPAQQQRILAGENWTEVLGA